MLCGLDLVDREVMTDRHDWHTGIFEETERTLSSQQKSDRSQQYCAIARGGGTDR